MDKFLLTRPLRDVTLFGTKAGPAIAISTHTPLAGRDSGKASRCRLQKISTHTPLAGRDLNFIFLLFKNSISTHTPLAGRDGYTEFTDRKSVV